MTPEQTKAAAEVMLLYAAGTHDVEWRAIDANTWVKIKDNGTPPGWDWWRNEYRAVPKPQKLRLYHHVQSDDYLAWKHSSCPGAHWNFVKEIEV